MQQRRQDSTRKKDLARDSSAKLHLINGGYGNKDKELLERLARGSRRAKSWVVPKNAAIGDEVVINVARNGFFATGRIASPTKLREDWNGYRYGADLDSIKLIHPPISLGAVRRRIPDLLWARYPRSINTPTPKLAEEVRTLVQDRRKTRLPDIDEAALASANLEELRALALLAASRADTPKQRKIRYMLRSKAVRAYCLQRANGYCEGCNSPAPFQDATGSPFLETHHTRRRAENGPDHPGFVIALCPNCHRHAECGIDAKEFNQALIRRLLSWRLGRESLVNVEADMAKHKVLTTDAEIDRAIERAQSVQEDPRVIRVEYRPGPGLDLLILTMSDGHRHVIPREDLQGLESATKAQIAEIEIVGNGTGLHWPALDLDHYVPALLRGVYGNRSWMARIGKKGGSVKSAAKKIASRVNGLQGGRPRRKLEAGRK